MIGENGRSRQVESVARRMHENIKGDTRLPNEASAEMRSACLLCELVSRGESDGYISRVANAYLDVAVEAAMRNNAFDALTAHTQNAHERTALAWMLKFCHRNGITVEIVSNIIACQARAAHYVDLSCGVSVIATVQNFNGEAYLAENPDVDAAISSGSCRNALDHFTSFGIAEKRSQRCYPNEGDET